MANPRQRKKARSSSHRPVSHSRHAKRNLKKTPPIRGPAILSERWDKHKTFCFHIKFSGDHECPPRSKARDVARLGDAAGISHYLSVPMLIVFIDFSYAALGLVHTLNPSASGGVEPIETITGHSEDAPVNLTAASTSSQPNAALPIPKGHGRIVRDEEGNILRVELAEEDEEMPEVDDRQKDMEELAPEVEPHLLSKWVTGLGGGKQGKGVVEELERIASSTHNTPTTLSLSISGAGPRHASGGEVAYLKRLVDKYGTDVEQMARDRKLNPEQRTVGQLTRSLKRCGFSARS
ncbi:Nucleolar protein 16 [Mycena venus]|uniref:Nucleolar protein 16 n=1 Tax=Mycena venus TaxID=2733690 RepID=A0A8H7CZF9_9AGAR|nr:Nucleolar protein 16 [Mycena venus]